jgi:CRP/FNR family transcriptional regulator, anaerobic regulatory protein
VYDKLLAHIQRYVSLSQEEQDVLCHYLKYKKIQKKELILKEGQVCIGNYFIIHGCLKLHTYKDKGTEQIIQFGIDNWWISDYMSLDAQKPSLFNIEAVEPTELVYLEKRHEEELFSKIPKLERYFRIIIQRAYAAYQYRIQYIFCQSGEERYFHFCDSFPDFVQRIPQYMVANYLGFTPEFVSKIRAKKR